MPRQKPAVPEASRAYDPSQPPEVNQALALYAIADALHSCAFWLKQLGGGGATDMGAVEFLAVQVRDGLTSVSSAIERVSL